MKKQMKRTGLIALSAIIVFFVATALLTGCGPQAEKQDASAKAPPQKPTVEPVDPVKTGATLYLSQAQFIYEKDETTGKSSPIPGPARLVIVTKTDTGWAEEVLEDPESNVFHKAMWFTPPEGEPGILTIGANKAMIKLWRKKDNTWTSDLYWNPVFGGKFDRLRDFEVADFNGDSAVDIAIATHDQGVVAVLIWKDGKYAAEELTREANMFVHEIEVGDVDGDGITEIFSTPSKPNKLDGTIQPGAVDMFKLVDGKWQHSFVQELETRHAKEILCVTLDGEDKPVLFASLEGERLGGDATAGGDNTKIRMYRFDGETISHEDIAGLPGRLCRFLSFGDIDGDGTNELVASTKSKGIWKLAPAEAGKQWKKSLIASGTSGFEHATYLFDGNGDGKDEIYVASDDQRELRQYILGPRGGFTAEILTPLKDSTITFNITAAMH